MADNDVQIIAHRGFAGQYPENTVAAARAAAERADSIEIDVQPTADGDVVAFHDDRLGARNGTDDTARGLTDATGVVWETDTETVTSARVLGTEETVPLLSELLDAIPPSVGVDVELKNPGSFDLRFAEALSDDELAAQIGVWRPLVERVLAILDAYEHEVRLSSFYEAALATTRELSDRAVAPILWDSVADGLEIARRYDAEAIHPPLGAVRGTPFYDEERYGLGSAGSGPTETDVLAAAHGEDRDVNCYTVRTWNQATELAAAGVDGLIADYPALLSYASRSG